MTNVSSTKKKLQNLHGSEPSPSSGNGGAQRAEAGNARILRAPSPTEIKQLLRKHADLSSEQSLLALLFACTERQLRATECGANAEQLFARLGKPVPSGVSQVNYDLFDENAFGYIYQLFRSPQRAASQKRAEQPNKDTALNDMIAFTQLFTPDWVIDFLLSKTLPNGSRRDATVLDPACGTGHFLLKAIDVLFEARVDDGEAPTEAMVSAIHQVHGCDVDALALWICRLAISLKALRRVTFDELPEANLELVIESASAPLGSLHRKWPSSHPLSKRYDAVVGNPPYLGRKLLQRELKTKLKSAYPNSHQDLCVAFVERGLELLKPGGKLGYITQASLLYLPTYGSLRKTILECHHIDTVVEAGPHVFPLQSGEKVNSALLVLSNNTSNEPSRFLDISTDKDKETALQSAIASNAFLLRDQVEFLSTRKNAFTYSCPRGLIIAGAQASPLSAFADIRQGLATTNNARFVKLRSAVPPEEIGKRWFPYAKGSGSERWYAPIDNVVDWQDNGAEIKRAVAEAYPYLNGKTEWVVKNEQYYFRQGLTFSFVNSGNLSVRLLPPGCIFDVGGSALFTSDEDRLSTLAYLNSSFIATAARQLNPTINFQVGDLKQLPYFDFSAKEKARLTELAQSCVDTKRAMFEAVGEEVSRLNQALSALETDIDELVLDLVLVRIKGLSPEARLELVAACDASASRRKPSAALSRAK